MTDWAHYTSYGGGLPDPIYDPTYNNTDYISALWKYCTDFGIHNITVGQTIEIYDCTFTVKSIETGQQIVLADSDGMAVSIPDWPWSEGA